jgi:hypothetical protein
MRYTLFALLTVFTSPILADDLDDCLRSNVLISSANAAVEVDAVGFDLSITNNLTMDLGGAIVRYELWSADRPVPLAASYAQFAHSIRGGLLSGETTTFKEFIGVTDRAKKLALSASALSVAVSLENVADLKMQPLGKSYDPFALWDEKRSNHPCEGRSD